MKARDMFLDAIRHAGAANRAGVRSEARFEKAVAHLSGARVGLPLAGLNDSGADAVPSPVADINSQAIVEELDARSASTSSPPGEAAKFEDLVSPLSKVDFFARQYARSRPMLFRGPSERFGSLVEWSGLDELVSSGSLNAENIQLFMEGAQLPKELYAMTPYGSGNRQREHDAEMIDGRKLLSFLRLGATLVIDAVHRSLQSVAELAHTFEGALHSYSYINLYASWHPTRGFGTHWDDHDVFVVQVHGEKLWQLYGPTRMSPTKVDTVLDDSAPSVPVWRGNLTAGDVFYIPRGWWHDAQVSTEKQGMGSVHLTCQVRTVTGNDVLVWLGSKLARYALFRKDVPLMAQEHQLAQYVEEFKSLVESVLGDRTANELKDDFRNRWTERPATAFGPWIEPWKSPEWDSYRLVLRGAEQANLTGNEDDGSIVLSANGWKYTLDLRCFDLVRTLAEQEGVTVAALKAVNPEMFSAGFVDEFAKTLIRKAIVVALPPLR